MAPPEKKPPLPPETLPKDFSNWDRGASAVPVPVNSGEWETWQAAHSAGKSPKPLGQFADRDRILESLVDAPRVSGSALPAPVFVKQQRNFIDWESEEFPGAIPVDRSEWEAWEATHSSASSPKPLGQSADRNRIPESLLQRPPVSGSPSPATVSLQPQKSASELLHLSPASDATRLANEVPVVPGLPNAASVSGIGNSPQLAATLRRDADDALFEMFRSKKIEGEEERKTARKKSMTVPAICAASILLPLVLMIPLFHHWMKPEAKQSVQPPPRESDTQLKTNTPAPSAAEPLTQDEPLTKTQGKQTKDNQPANNEEAVQPAEVPAEMMIGQLAAPAQIPQEIKKPVVDNGPPPASFGAAGADDLDAAGANNAAFNGHAQPVIKVAPPPPKPLEIPLDVASRMLVHKVRPYYPPKAKAAGVSGCVELHATISKKGTVKDLRVVSGPAMLQQVALDAVKTWRYKPYRVNHQPTEVGTKIYITFPGK
jgi:protein TonB